jgi:hypothetical protein
MHILAMLLFVKQPPNFFHVWIILESSIYELLPQPKCSLPNTNSDKGFALATRDFLYCAKPE